MNIREYMRKTKGNKENTNCGSFALGVDYWVDFSYDFAGFDEEIDSIEDFELDLVSQILEYVPNIRQITTPKGVKKGEYLVLFRVAYDSEYEFDDFHFVIKTGKGKYLHKSGANPRIKEMNEREVFKEAWRGRYDGQIYYFARKIES